VPTEQTALPPSLPPYLPAAPPSCPQALLTTSQGPWATAAAMRTGWAARALQWCRSVLSSALSGRSSLSQLPIEAALLGSLRRACLGGVARCTVADWHVWRMLKSLSCSVSIAAPANYRTRCPALGRASWLSARRPGRLALKQLFLQLAARFAAAGWWWSHPRLQVGVAVRARPAWSEICQPQQYPPGESEARRAHPPFRRLPPVPSRRRPACRALAAGAPRRGGRGQPEGPLGKVGPGQ
jgi:hypothetical protein